MTKKDFELIAGALASARQNAQTWGEEAGTDRAAAYIAGDLQQVFPRFNRVRFLEACKAVP
jgi:hypothetical protein